MAQHHHRYALRSHARRERSSSSSSPSPRHKAPRTSSLPVDLLRNVLSRLPTISLLKLRSVCREWRDIIDDPHFAAMHARSGVESPRILLLSGPRHGRGADPQFAVDDRFLSLLILAMGRWLRTSRASCHGLHCFEDLRHGVTYIVNPLTREFISLKNVEPWPWQRIGIGFDRQTGRYKIVCVSYSMDCVVFPLRAAVLDQGSRSWRDIASVPSSLDLDEGPVFAAGSIHWKTNGRGGTLGVGIRISSFDLTQEEFGWTPCPALRDAHLVDLQGVLGLVDCSRKESMDVWAVEKGKWMCK
ncbi:hypothetical protein EUGRSUZ_J00721 [Eucalyptus grandis]|uniref:F-box domain-containing protein n=2 Tax=Eucalyptus grandis TaxID=71139 RepID=A0A059AB99_EUCGR|nr:hypothetical protein EUGRSUZ_J00721 [Eucalyptus grandis]